MNFEQPPANPQEQKSTPEEEQLFMPSPESIAALENDNRYINWQDKLYVFLAACELKAASHIGSFVRYKEEQAELEKLLTDMELQFSVVQEEATDPNDGEVQGTILDYMVARSSENLQKAVEAFHSVAKDDGEGRDEEAFGLAMGYPETAVRAFQRESDGMLSENPDSPLLHKQEIKELLTTEEDEFTFFRPSREHWQEEMEWVRKIIEVTKKHAPRIYEQNMSDNN